MRCVLAILGILAAAGCAARSPYDRVYVSKTLEERTGHPLAARPQEPGFPAGVSLDDGLTEDEAIAVALWNNAQFQVDLAELAFARADLLSAGLLPNPLLSYLHLFGVKGTEGYVLWPLDALWQRPKRVATAKYNAQRIADGLVQHGLALGRDVLIGYADLDLAEKQAALVREDARVRREIAGLAAARYRSGDISGLEESAARLDALRAEDDALLAARDAETARARFAALLGFGDNLPTITLTATPDIAPDSRPLPELLAAAYAARPDLRAAQAEVEAAGARLGWERAMILKFTATLDAKEKGEAGMFAGPSAKIEIPIFNRNEGGRARARAEMERAAAKYVAVRQAIAAELRSANAEVEAAKQSVKLFEGDTLPGAAAAALQARKAYAVGEESYLFVLEAEHRELDIRRRAAGALADLRRAGARLKCATGFSTTGQSPAADPTTR
ncbi:MAG: TolC family protein [Candidatus Aminicenantes bacterium]|nr:TolC family protein [Candidatus Aminicenantes bacterium]